MMNNVFDRASPVKETSVISTPGQASTPIVPPRRNSRRDASALTIAQLEPA
jgi:hypothetical protein